MSRYIFHLISRLVCFDKPIHKEETKQNLRVFYRSPANFVASISSGAHGPPFPTPPSPLRAFQGRPSGFLSPQGQFAKNWPEVWTQGRNCTEMRALAPVSQREEGGLFLGVPGGDGRATSHVLGSRPALPAPPRVTREVTRSRNPRHLQGAEDRRKVSPRVQRAGG